MNPHPPPFPADCLPAPARRLVAEGASAIGCDPAMIGPVVLAAMAAAIGNARTIELQPGWREPSVLWVGVVAPSGSAKSPALEKAVRPLEARDHAHFRAYTAAMAEHEARKGAEPVANDRPDFPPEQPPGVPVCERLVTSDATLEALAALLQSSPRGILFAADELAAMLGGLSRYGSGGRQSTEEARWLPFHRAGALKLDRRTRGPIRVDRAAVSIAGMIQPGVLARVLTTADFQSGLVARLLLAMPLIPRRTWRADAGLPEATESAYAAMIDRLLSLPVVPDADPPALRIESQAERVWAEYFDALNGEMALSDEPTRAMLSKLEGGAARLALVVHLSRWASGEAVDTGCVDADSMARGVALARWFAGEARRVYAMIGESEAERADRELIELIRRNGGTITKRELMQADRRRFPTAGDAQEALDAMQADGLGKWQYPKPGPAGGHPQSVFALCETHNPG